jgi:DNA-binding SARP family transcriptional activator
MRGPASELDAGGPSVRRARRTGVDLAAVPTIDPDVRLTLLSGFELGIDGRPVPLAPSGQRLIAFLALQDRWTPRSLCAGTLWPDSPEVHAAANLRSVLWRLNVSPHPLVHTSRSDLRLASSVWVDVHEMTRGAEGLFHAAGPHAGTEDGSALEVDRGAFDDDLLPDWTDDWVMVERERLRQLRLHALEVLCDRLTDARRFGEAVQAGLAAVRAEPLRESAQRSLIRAHLAEGNLGEALRQYRSFRQLLQEELGVAPSPELEDLVVPIDRLALSG